MRSWLPQWKAMRMGGSRGESQRPIRGNNNQTWGGMEKTQMILVECFELHQEEGWEDLVR
jgi:hypothetical protein